MMGAMKDAGRKDAVDRIEKAAAEAPAGALSVEGYDGEMLAFGYDAAHDAGWRALDPDEVQDAGEVYFAPGFGAEKKTSYRYSAHAVSMNGDADLEFEAEIVSDKPLSLEEIYERMWEKVPAAYGLPKDRKQAMKDFKVTMTDLMKKADAAKRSGDGDTMTALQDELRKHPFPQIDQLTYGEGPGEATIRLAQNPGEFDALTKQGVPAAAFSPKPDPEFEKALRANGMKPEDFPLPPPGYAETAEMRFNAPASDILMARRVIANEDLSIGKDLLGRPYLKEGEGSAFVVNVESAEFEKDWAQYSALISRGELESEVAYQYADDLKAAEEIDFPVRLEVSAESGEEDDEAVARCLREKYGLQLVLVTDIEWNQDLDESAAVRPGKDTISVTQLLRELRSFPDKGAKLAYIVNAESGNEPADGSGEWVKTLELVYDSDSYAKIVIGWTPDERDAMTVGAFSAKLSAAKDRRVAIEVQDKGGSFNVVQAEVRNGPGFAGIVFDCGAPVARKALNEAETTAIAPSAVASALRKSGDKVLAYEVFFVECQTLEDRDGGEKEGPCEGVELDGKFAAFDGDTLG